MISYSVSMQNQNHMSALTLYHQHRLSLDQLGWGLLTRTDKMNCHKSSWSNCIYNTKSVYSTCGHGYYWQPPCFTTWFSTTCSPSVFQAFSTILKPAGLPGLGVAYFSTSPAFRLPFMLENPTDIESANTINPLFRLFSHSRPCQAELKLVVMIPFILYILSVLFL